MTKLYVQKSDKSYRPASRAEVAAWCQAAVAARVPGQLVHTPADAADFVREALRVSPSEVFAVVYLDQRHRVIQFAVEFHGTIDSTTVHPREIVRRAIELGAAAVIFAHNHPSSVTTPSDADRIITARLRSALELVDVRVLDHLIVGGNAVASMAQLGLM